MTEISVSSPIVLDFGYFHLTNTVLGGLVTTLIAVVFIVLYGRKPKLVPGRIQVLIEMMITFFLDMLKGSYSNEKRARSYLSFYITLFLFLLIANQFSVIPLLSNVKAGENYLLRMSTADFSQTIALSLIAIIGGHVIALTKSPIKHFNNFFKIDKIFAVRKFSDIPNLLIELFLGCMDIIGEFAKIVSLSARLFGNIFAGDVMVVVIAGLSVYTTYLVPVPFLFLGMFSSLVQAFVFAILCMQFMAGTILAAEPQQKKN